MKTIQIIILQMKINKLIVIFLFLVLILQSNYAQNINRTITPRFSEKEILKMKQQILVGDTLAFFKYMFYVNQTSEKFHYAFYMANKFNNPLSYFYVYLYTLEFFQENQLVIDSLSYTFAFQYLLKGAEHGSTHCNDQLAIIYYFGNRYIPQDFIKAKEYYTSSFTDFNTKEIKWNSFMQLYQKSILKKEERF